MAAKEKFPAEFESTRYNSQGEPMEKLLADIASWPVKKAVRP